MRLGHRASRLPALRKSFSVATPVVIDVMEMKNTDIIKSAFFALGAIYLHGFPLGVFSPCEVAVVPLSRGIRHISASLALPLSVVGRSPAIDTETLKKSLGTHLSDMILFLFVGALMPVFHPCDMSGPTWIAKLHSPFWTRCCGRLAAVLTKSGIGPLFCKLLVCSRHLSPRGCHTYHTEYYTMRSC